MMAMRHGAGKRDAVDRLRKVPLGLRAGANAGDETTLAAELVGLADRIERDRVVEVGERDDQHGEDRDVHEVLRVHDVLVDEVRRVDRATPQYRCRGRGDQITGSSRIELAKMIGITPDWLTLSGM